MQSVRWSLFRQGVGVGQDDNRVPQDPRSVRARFGRSVTGLSLVAFIASRHGDTDIWLDSDTASHGGIILDQPLASLVGLVIATGSNAQIEVRVGDGAPVRVNIEPKGQI